MMLLAVKINSTYEEDLWPSYRMVISIEIKGHVIISEARNESAFTEKAKAVKRVLNTVPQDLTASVFRCLF